MCIFCSRNNSLLGCLRLTIYYRTRFYVPQKLLFLTSCVCTLHVTHSFCSGRSDHKRFHHPGTCQHAESGQQASHPTAQIQPASSQHREHGKLCQWRADTVSGAASEGKETKQKELARDELGQTYVGCVRHLFFQPKREQPQQMASPWWCDADLKQA